MRKTAGKLDYRWAAAALIPLLVIFNIAFFNSNGWARVFWQLFGFVSLLSICYFAGLNFQDVGLAKKNFKTGVVYAAISIVIVLAAMIIVFLLDDTFFKDKRYHHALSTALYSGLILVPLKTVFFEELVFRGMLPTLLVKNYGRKAATIAASLAFGLWHISSATTIGNYNIGANIVVPKVVVILAVFVATSTAGYVFCWLRWRSNSLLAPIGLHWFINGGAIIIAALSWKL